MTSRPISTTTTAAATNGNHHYYYPPTSSSSSSSASFRGCCCCCLFLLFSFLALLVLAVILVIVLAVKPKKPEFNLQQVGVQYVGISPTTDSSASVSLTIRMIFTAANDNEVEIKYGESRFTIMYRGIPLGRGTVPGFTQPAHSVRRIETIIAVDRVNLLQADAADLVRDASLNDRVELQVDGDVGAKIRILGVTSPGVEDLPCRLESLARRLWSYKISKDKYKRLYLLSKGVSVEDFEMLKASNASLEEELEKKGAQLEAFEKERSQWEEERRRLALSLEKAKEATKGEQSQKANVEELLKKKEEELVALHSATVEERQKLLDEGRRLEEERWTTFVLSERKKGYEEEAVRRFLSSPLFNYLATTKAYPQVQGAFDKGVAQVRFLGALKEDVDLGAMAVYLGKDLSPEVEDESSSDFSGDEFFFALQMVQDQVLAEMMRRSEEESEGDDGEEQGGALPTPGVEAGGVEVPPSAGSEISRGAEAPGADEQVNPASEKAEGRTVPTQEELFAAEKWLGTFEVSVDCKIAISPRKQSLIDKQCGFDGLSV